MSHACSEATVAELLGNGYAAPKHVDYAAAAEKATAMYDASHV